MYVQFTYCVQGLSKTNFFQQHLYLLINKSKKNIKRKLKSSIKSFFKQQKTPLFRHCFMKINLWRNLERKRTFYFIFCKKFSLVKTKIKLWSPIEYMTDNLHILYFSFEDDIAKVIESLDSNKAHDHNSISIRYPALRDLVPFVQF